MCVCIYIYIYIYVCIYCQHHLVNFHVEIPKEFMALLKLRKLYGVNKKGFAELLGYIKKSY